jgi:hypothetical protein
MIAKYACHPFGTLLTLLLASSASAAQAPPELADSGRAYPLTCTPDPVERIQSISCVVRAPGWEVAGWEFVSDREPGSDYVFFHREDCPIREWAGPALMSGRVRVHLSRDTARRSFETHFTVTDRPSRWRESWSFRVGDSTVAEMADSQRQAATAAAQGTPLAAPAAPAAEASCTRFVSHERRRVWRDPERLLSDLARAYEAEKLPPTTSMDLTAIMLGRAAYTGGSVEAVLDGLEPLALGSGPVDLRIRATQLIGTSGSRDALEPRPEALARLQRVYRGSTEWQVLAAVVDALARSADHGAVLAFLAEIATSPPKAYPGASMSALAAIASHADSGVPTLRRLHESGAIRDSEASWWLDRISRTGYRVR